MSAALVEGAIFTRSPKDKKNTAIFIGGSNMPQGEAVLAATRAKFFAKFRVSVMFDCNGSNTTASAAVAWLAHGRSLHGKRAVVLAGSGPVGQRAALLLAREGAQVAITGRKQPVVQAACDAINARFGIDVQAIEAPTHLERSAALERRTHRARDRRLRHNSVGGESLASEPFAGVGGRRECLAARRHRRRGIERSRRQQLTARFYLAP